jgi:hypothetical protein
MLLPAETPILGSRNLQLERLNLKDETSIVRRHRTVAHDLGPNLQGMRKRAGCAGANTW